MYIITTSSRRSEAVRLRMSNVWNPEDRVETDWKSDEKIHVPLLGKACLVAKSQIMSRNQSLTVRINRTNKRNHVL